MEHYIEVFGAFSFGLAVLIYLINKQDKRIDKLETDLKDERKEHDLYVDKVSEAFIAQTSKYYGRNTQG